MKSKKYMSITVMIIIAVIVLFIGLSVKNDMDRIAMLQTLKGEIVYTQRDRGVAKICKISADGSNKKMLYHNENESNPNALFPRWSEDKTKIYFSAMKDNQFISLMMDADGKNVQPADRLVDTISTNSREVDIKVKRGSVSYIENGKETTVYSCKIFDPKLNTGASEASWGPDKKHIIFQSCSMIWGCRIMIADKNKNVVELTEGMQPDW